MTFKLNSPVLFADDTALYRPKYSESDSPSLQEDIFNLQKWANTWQMAFNVTKCKLLCITNRKSSVIKCVQYVYIYIYIYMCVCVCACVCVCTICM